VTAPPPLPATSAPARIPALDALRGIAVAGIVAMNVHAFALPGPAYYNPLAYGGIGPADRWVWLVSFVFIEDKFRTLFAMLFGAGCLILLEKGATHPWRAHYARMAVLFVIGLAHATLLASNDVLRAYALAGLAVPLLAGLSARALVTVAIGLLVVHVALGMVALGPALVDHLRHRIGSDALIFAERQFGRDPMVITMLLEQGREGLAARAVRRAGAIPAQMGVLIAALPLNLAAIALGMGLWKGGMLRGGWRLFWLQRLAGGCALVALPALLGLAAWLEVAGFPAALVGPVALVLSAPFDVALAVSYAALAMAFIKAERGLARRLAMAGRLSLSNYLLTSLILAALFAPWGLGLFGAVTRWQALALGAVPVAVMLAWSPWWAERFGQGPLERLWRAAARRLS